MNFNNAKFVSSYGKFEQIPQSDRPEVALSGKSNVGKSTLINKIFNRKSLAKVSSVPGKTATINFYSVDDIHIVDLPGYGYANVSKGEKESWKKLVNGYLCDFDRDLMLILQLIDSRHSPSKEDLQMINFMIENELPFMLVFTKTDKLKPTARKDRMEKFKTEIPYFDDIQKINYSSITGEGIENIRSTIEEVVQNDFD